ncbi:Protein ODORANT1 [Hordeum vulgare]|nr:Protein ODORANT1 [Hordeum vulgare]
MRLRRQRWKRRHQAKSHRTKTGYDCVDGVSIPRVAKRSPKLQEATHFEHRISCTPKRNTLNNKLISNRPQRQCKHPNHQPPSMADTWRQNLEFGELIGEVRVAPSAADHFAETTPKQLCAHAREEDVVQVFLHRTERTNALPRAIALEHLNTRGYVTMNPLSKEYLNI